MGRAIRIIIVAGASCVATVFSVPAFAQSGSVMKRSSIALERTVDAGAREYVPVELIDAALGGLPSNLELPPVFRPFFESMLRRSPTFARQCMRIANASELTVTLQFTAMTAARSSRPARARTAIVRRNNRLMATIVIAQAADLVELVAHEIEHVIEQLDGVDLASKAQRADSGVRALHHDGVVFETTRAQRIGLQVAEEVRRRAPDSAWRW